MSAESVADGVAGVVVGAGFGVTVGPQVTERGQLERHRVADLLGEGPDLGQRAGGGRLREDATRTLSMLTIALRANMTASNQADHCILAQPVSTGAHVPKTVDTPNHVFDSTFCKDSAGAPVKVGAMAAPALSAQASQLGGTIDADAFTEAEVNALAKGYTSTSLLQVNTTQVAVTRAYQTESFRLEEKIGADHPKTRSLAAQAEAGVVTQQFLTTSAEAFGSVAPVVPDAGAAISGRLVNSKGQGQAGFAVELVNTAGAQAAALGRSDKYGAFGDSFDADETTRLARLGKLRARVLDAAGAEVLGPGTAVCPGEMYTDTPVSYTHLTLPTNREV